MDFELISFGVTDWASKFGHIFSSWPNIRSELSKESNYFGDGEFISKHGEINGASVGTFVDALARYKYKINRKQGSYLSKEELRKVERVNNLPDYQREVIEVLSDRVLSFWDSFKKIEINPRVKLDNQISVKGVCDFIGDEIVWDIKCYEELFPTKPVVIQLLLYYCILKSTTYPNIKGVGIYNPQYDKWVRYVITEEDKSILDDLNICLGITKFSEKEIDWSRVRSITAKNKEDALCEMSPIMDLWNKERIYTFKEYRKFDILIRIFCNKLDKLIYPVKEHKDLVFAHKNTRLRYLKFVNDYCSQVVLLARYEHDRINKYEDELSEIIKFVDEHKLSMKRLQPDSFFYTFRCIGYWFRVKKKKILNWLGFK
ncbi:hypothetical protein [Candidatus Mycoplasma haematohominis]|uniref:hypothetical protein n=1 Tax=Candidatus Mycoplasma haematohominis TaxID=1494318 RepID=UPI001C0A6959|nr:hypothetical protein [Candidatus Mycoplasma haemohominis]